MKKAAFIIALLLCSLLSASGQEKQAILMVHFGTTYDSAREATFGAINAKVAEAFPEAYVTEAYTSRIVIKNLKVKGIEKPTPKEALLRLAADGYTNVFIQATFLLDGIEMANLNHEAEQMKPFFKDIRVGRPLLYSIDDCLETVNILAAEYISAPMKSHHTVFVGHGSPSPNNAVYSQLDKMFESEGYANCHVATIEGYPTEKNIIDQLKREKAKSVTLIPLLFVAGDHASNDISVDWKEMLEAEGYEVNVIIRGLGQIEGIHQIYVNRIAEGLETKPVSAIERKANFIKEND